MTSKVVSPSDEMISMGEIVKIQELLGHALRKSGLQSKSTQVVIEHHGAALTAELLVVVRQYVDQVSARLSKMVVRHVMGGATQEWQQALAATGGTQHVDQSVAAAMPRGDGKEADIYLFPGGRYLSDADLDREYGLHGLRPIGPYTLLRMGRGDDLPNVATVWKDAAGRWCYAAFGEMNNANSVGVGLRKGRFWGPGWWFAGVPK